MKRSVYTIVLHSPMGPKKGTLTFFEDSGSHECSVDIYLMGKLNHFAARLIRRGEYRLSGSLLTLVGKVACKVNVTIRNGILYAIADTEKGIMKIEGRLIESNKSDSH